MTGGQATEIVQCCYHMKMYDKDFLYIKMQQLPTLHT